MGQRWPAAGLGALSVAMHAWDLVKDVVVIFITSTIVWSQANNREGTQPRPSTKNWMFLTKLKTELPHDPAIPLLDLYLEKTLTKIYMHPSVHSSTIYNS